MAVQGEKSIKVGRGDEDMINVYHHRDIPITWHTAQRTALGYLLRGPMKPAILGQLAGIPSKRARAMISHVATMTHHVGNLCESDCGSIGLVAPDGYSVIGE